MNSHTQANIFTDGYFVDGKWIKREVIPECLKWENRSSRILKEMIDGDVDFISLQEVEPYAFKEFSDELKTHGYAIW